MTPFPLPLLPSYSLPSCTCFYICIGLQWPTEALDCCAPLQIKNFVLLGDVQRSVYFLHWKEDTAVLSQLARDFAELHTMAAEFLIDGPNLGLVVTDDRKNAKVLRCLVSKQASGSHPGRQALDNAAPRWAKSVQRDEHTPSSSFSAWLPSQAL